MALPEEMIDEQTLSSLRQLASILETMRDSFAMHEAQAARRFGGAVDQPRPAPHLHDRGRAEPAVDQLEELRKLIGEIELELRKRGDSPDEPRPRVDPPSTPPVTSPSRTRS